MTAIFALMTILLPIVTAFTALVKKIEVVPNKYVSLVPLVIGLVISPLFLTLPFVSATLAEIIWAGALSGLAAGGFYSVTNIPNKDKEE